MHQKTVQTQKYLSAERLKQEKRALFEGSWIFAALSSQLSNGAVLPISHIKGSILLTRDQQGRAHAFVNSCLHRSTRLVQGGQCPTRTGESERSGLQDQVWKHLKSRVTSLTPRAWKGEQVSKIGCPYHGWLYDHEGRLVHVPKKEGMDASWRASACSDALNLQERHKTKALNRISLVERDGMIWVNLSASPSDIEEHLGPLSEHFTPYKLEEFEPIEASDYEFPANWKIVLENALDYYHVPTAHKSTVNAHVEIQPTYEELQQHNLQTIHIAPYGWRGWLDRHCSRGGPYRPEQLASLHKYYIFPNLILNILPYHLTIMQLFPVAQNSCVMRYRFCKRRGAGILENSRAYVTWLASRFILYEDAVLYPAIQQGMAQQSMEQCY